MGERGCHIARKLYFCRWSRKGYAVFASLGREVHIGQLALHVCAMSLKKAARKGLVIVRELLADFGRQELENGENAGDGPGKDLFDRCVVSVAMIRVGNEGDRQMVDWEKEYEYCNDTGMSVGAGMFFYFFKICQ